MAGLQGFVGRQGKLDTEAAQALKIPTKNAKKSTVAQAVQAPVPAPHKLASTAPARYQLSPPTRFVAQPPQHIERGFDDATVDTDFDVTKSEIGFNQDHDYEGEDEGRQQMTQQFVKHRDRPYSQVGSHKLHHVQAQEDLHVDTLPSSSPKIHARIDNRFSGTAHHMDLQHRPGQLEMHPALGAQQEAGAKKRDRPRENVHRVMLKIEDEIENSDDLPEPQNGRPRQSYSDEAESTPGPSPTRKRAARPVDRQQSSQGALRGERYGVSPDHSDGILAMMDWNDFNNESWDGISLPKSIPQPIIEPPVLSLVEAMKMLTDEGGDVLMEDGTMYFQNIPAEQWEEAGDWLLERFAEVLKQLKAKRKEKRAITEKYEAEIEKRQKAVQCRSDLLDKKFKEMETSAQEVLKGKMVFSQPEEA